MLNCIGSFERLNTNTSSKNKLTNENINSSNVKDLYLSIKKAIIALNTIFIARVH